MYIAILNFSANKRVEKFQEFETLEEADSHVSSFIGSFPDAFSAQSPAGGVAEWLVDDADSQNKTVSNSPGLADAKTDRIAAMKVAQVAALALGFHTNSIKMDTNEAHVLRLKGAYDLAILKSESTMDVIDFDNATNSAVAVATVLNIIIDLGTNARTLALQFQARRTSINAASDVAAVNAINWS